MQTLLSFINDAFKSYGGYRGKYKEVQEFIGNDKKCLSLIYDYLDIGRDDVSVLNKKNFNRASHILVTFLLGHGISRINNIINGSNKFNNLPDEYLWMITALLHDYGYFRKELSINQSLDDLKLEYNLLTDEYDVNALHCLNNYSIRFQDECTFSYETIRKYYNYKIDYSLSYGTDENDELNDHGILGACLAFKQYIDFYLKYEYPNYKITAKSSSKELVETEPLLYKTACIIAAQHNMYKSCDEKSDIKYIEYELDDLLSTAPIKINSRNPILLLLSIVDTIECSKRFSKKSNPKHYLATMTILRKISIDVTPFVIELDFTDLHDYIIEKRKSDEMEEQLLKHIDIILDIGSWTSYEAIKTTSYSVIIKAK